VHWLKTEALSSVRRLVSRSTYNLGEGRACRAANEFITLKRGNLQTDKGKVKAKMRRKDTEYGTAKHSVC